MTEQKGVAVMIFDDGIVLSKDDFDNEKLKPHKLGRAFTDDEWEEEICKAFIRGSCNENKGPNSTIESAYKYWESIKHGK